MAAPMVNRHFESLDLKRKLAYTTKSFDQIHDVSYHEFFEQYLVANRPCIFSPDLTKHWKSRNCWVTKDGFPNFDYLREHFGEAVVPVANCKQEQYSSHPKQDMTMAEYLTYWEQYIARGYQKDEECLYLKDWHFAKSFPIYAAYETPLYFQSDWLNEFWDTQLRDDYRFVYMGPKGTWTPFHADVYRSFSWSANICGRKRWIFYPPGCEDSLKDQFGQLIYDITSPDLDDPRKYPHSGKVKGQRLEVLQEQGQVIFVPSGWHHQVYNMEDTISINHNWLNGCNIDICWRHLQDNLASVKSEISDCIDMDGWTQQCQLMLNAVAGIDYKTFVHMLKVVTKNRLLALQKARKCLESEKNTENTGHVGGTPVRGGIYENENTLGERNEERTIENKVSKISSLSNDSQCKRNSETVLDDGINNKVNHDVGEFTMVYAGGDSKKENNAVNVIDAVERDISEYSCKGFDNRICDSEHESDTVDDDKLSKKQQIANYCEEMEELSENVTTHIRIHETISAEVYLMYDLLRVKEVLTTIIDDEDYKQIEFDDLDNAQYILDIINEVVK